MIFDFFDLKSCFIHKKGYYKWYSKSFINSIDQIRQEYIQFRKLYPLKIYITGQPASGKTFYSQYISKKYYLPHIKIADVIKEAELDLKNQHDINEYKQQLLEQEEEDLKKKKKKKK